MNDTDTLHEIMIVITLDLCDVDFCMLFAMQQKEGFNYWFARDVMAAMLVVNNKVIFIIWKLNSIFISLLHSRF